MALSLWAKRTIYRLAGDTFEAISQQCYGSPDYANLIIAANGLTAGQVPTPSQRLTIPQMIPMTNKAGNYRAYDEFMSIIIGSLYPHLETPQPESSGWESIVCIIVAVVVACVAPELLGAALSTLFAEGALQTAVASVRHCGFDGRFYEWADSAAKHRKRPNRQKHAEIWGGVGVRAAGRDGGGVTTQV